VSQDQFSNTLTLFLEIFATALSEVSVNHPGMKTPGT
jgi:hypothetical protein